MSNTDDKAQQLLRRYLDGSLNRDEFREFLSLLAGIDKSSLSEELFNLWESSASQEFSLPEEEWNNRMRKLTDEIENFHSKNHRKIYRNKGQKILSWGKVAAAILILATAGGVFWIMNSRQENKSGILADLSNSEYDIQPGGNRAILTLENGTRITLDSIRNGTVVTQGNTEIVKLDDGKLIYNVIEKEESQILINNKIITPRGGQYQVQLPDGTRVWLNSASSISFPSAFKKDERSIEITGEVYFEVAHDARRPFIVKTGDARVKVLGTRFNINAYEDEDAVKVTLLEGKVNVSSPTENSVTLSPGQQASLSKTGVLDVAQVDPETAVTWKNGYFQFDHADIQTVMRQLSRWYDVEVVYENNVPKQLFGGEMQRNLTLSQVLNILGKSQVKFRIEERKIIVMN